MQLGEVDPSLAALDFLEPDLVLEVDTTDTCMVDLHLTEASMEHLFTFH